LREREREKEDCTGREDQNQKEEEDEDPNFVLKKFHFTLVSFHCSNDIRRTVLIIRLNSN